MEIKFIKDKYSYTRARKQGLEIHYSNIHGLKHELNHLAFGKTKNILYRNVQVLSDIEDPDTLKLIAEIVNLVLDFFIAEKDVEIFKRSDAEFVCKFWKRLKAGNVDEFLKIPIKKVDVAILKALELEGFKAEIKKNIIKIGG